jgi:hypothetical protein
MTAVRAILVAACASIALAQDPARDALNLGHTRDQALFDSFTRGYTLGVSGTIDNAEIITEFRRAVLLVRESENVGSYIQDARALTNAMAPYAGLVTVVVQARLNPLNTFATPPAYELYVSTGPATKAIGPRPFQREAIYPLGAATGNGMIAVRLTGSFPRAEIESAASPSLVVTDDRAEVLWQQRLDLSRYR